MTADMPDYPGAGPAALFGSGDDLAAALAGAGLTDWIEKNVGGALGAVSPATRAAATREITATVASLLNVNPVDVLVGAWRTYKKITDAARGTLAAAGSTELLPLATHQISETSNPSVDVLVDGYRIAALQLSISIVCEVQAMLAKISAGRLVAIESGRCYVTAALAIAGAEITSRTTRFDLARAVPLGRGLRLLPAEEYAAAGRRTQHDTKPLARERCLRTPRRRQSWLRLAATSGICACDRACSTPAAPEDVKLRPATGGGCRAVRPVSAAGGPR